MRRHWLLLTAFSFFVGWLCGCQERPKLILWHSYTGSEREQIDALVNAYQALHPELPIESTFIPYDVFSDKLSSAIPRGNGPDLFIAAHDRIGDWKASGVIAPIDYFVDETTAQTFLQPSLEALVYENRLYGLPMSQKCMALFYRPSLIAQPPRTTDDLLKLDKNQLGVVPLLYKNTDLYGHALWLHGFGGNVFDAQNQPSLETPQAIQAAEFAAELVKRGVVSREITDALITTLFSEHKAAMIVSGPWFVTEELKRDKDWAVTTLPTVSSTGRPAAPFLGVEGLLLSKASTHAAEAFGLMKYLTSDESAAARFAHAGQLVPNLAVADNDQAQSNPAFAAFFEQMKTAVPMSGSPAMRVVWSPYETALQNIVVGGKSAQTELQRADQDVKRFLRGQGEHP